LLSKKAIKIQPVAKRKRERGAMQGLNTTPVHGHTALFEVYGMLGIGLMLFCLRASNQLPAHQTRALKILWTVIMS